LSNYFLDYLDFKFPYSLLQASHKSSAGDPE